MTQGHEVSLEEARDALAAEWEHLNPRTEEEIRYFYQHTLHYVDDLNAWHDYADRQAWSTILWGAVRASGAKRILDVGAGLGHDVKYVLDEAEKTGHPSPIVEVVEPNDYMRGRIEDELGIVTWISLDEMLASPGKMEFDLISILDVLEHVPNPDKLLEQMISVLKPNGFIVEATATHDTSTPLHLESLRGWSPARILDQYGFLIQEEFGDGRLRIWRRVAEKRNSSPNLLVCAYRDMRIETVGSVLRLADKGWRRSFHRGDALISRVRSVAVSKWYQEDAGDVFLMVDDDIVFNPEDAEKVVALARRTEGIASAAYPTRGGNSFASRFDNAEPFDLTFGPNLEPVEIIWAGTGFIAVHRKVVEALVKAEPEVCILNDETWFWPMFQPFKWYNQSLKRWEYLSEDWAFCERARQLGFKVWLDRTVILGHLGTFEYNVANMADAREIAPPTDGGF